MKEYIDQNIFQSTLWDPVWGDVWDLDAGHTLAHPNCRCQLAVRIKLEALNVQREAELLLRELRLLRHELERVT